MIKKVKLQINGMHCTSCAMNIDGELEDNGVIGVKTNYAKSETDVEFDDSKISLNKIQDIIASLGYASTIQSK